MKLLLAVSGGIDSMYLAYRASDFYPEASFAVAHCNFRLRGEESDADEKFVRDWCDARGLTCRVTHFDTVRYAEDSGKSIEMAARELRYSWFTEMCDAEGCDAVVVAHNANDNAETLMLNLLRGTGSRGLRGMAPLSTRADGLKILRPMLNISREEITGWMLSNGYAWREDSTNAGNFAKRNILRNEVFPILKGINPSFLDTLGSDMARFSLVDDIAEDYFNSCGIRLTDGAVRVDALLALKHWRYVLWRLLDHCGLSEPTFNKLVELLSRYKELPRGTVTMSGKTFESPTHIIKTSKGKLTVTER